MYQTLLGVTGSGKTYTMANVIARRATGLVLAPNKTLAAQPTPSSGVLPENAVEYFVSYYDYYQPEAYVPSRDLSSRRTARSTSTSSRCAVGDQEPAGTARRGHRRHGVVHLRHRRSGRLPRDDPAPARGRRDGARDLIQRLVAMQYSATTSIFAAAFACAAT